MYPSSQHRQFRYKLSNSNYRESVKIFSAVIMVYFLSTPPPPRDPSPLPPLGIILMRHCFQIENRPWWFHGYHDDNEIRAAYLPDKKDKKRGILKTRGD